MQKNNISSAVAQELFASAPNAAEKGQAQYFTPREIGNALAHFLPDHRPVIVDLTAGAGDLLAAARNRSTHNLLACDIDASKLHANLHPIGSDLALVYPLFRQVDWCADLFVLNPPWDLHWYRDKLAGLAESECAAVRETFAMHDGRTAKGTIDSTIATICIALDRMTALGEGFCIVNESTLQRLVMAPDAPHSALKQHIWAHIPIASLLSERRSHCDLGPFANASAIFFAKEHTDGPGGFNLSVALNGYSARMARTGAEVTGEWDTKESQTVTKWIACRQEIARRQAKSAAGTSGYNIYLNADGRVITALSLYDQHDASVDKDAAKRLFELNGKTPMQLVVQRASRDELMFHAGLKTEAGTGSGTSARWRVAPGLVEAVRAAITAYETARAPLTPLSDTMRLGYLDEHDRITCKLDLFEEVNGSRHCRFRAGETYPLQTQTVPVQRKTLKPDLHGEMEEHELSGQELVFIIGDEDAIERRFRRDADRANKLALEAAENGSRTATPALSDALLAKHFIIPEVPDVAQINPAGYQRNLDLLRQIEVVTS